MIHLRQPLNTHREKTAESLKRHGLAKKSPPHARRVREESRSSTIYMQSGGICRSRVTTNQVFPDFCGASRSFRRPPSRNSRKEQSTMLVVCKSARVRVYRARSIRRE